MVRGHIRIKSEPGGGYFGLKYCRTSPGKEGAAAPSLPLDPLSPPLGLRLSFFLTPSALMCCGKCIHFFRECMAPFDRPSLPATALLERRELKRARATAVAILSPLPPFPLPFLPDNPPFQTQLSVSNTLPVSQRETDCAFSAVYLILKFHLVCTPQFWLFVEHV